MQNAVQNVRIHCKSMQAQFGLSLCWDFAKRYLWLRSCFGRRREKLLKVEIGLISTYFPTIQITYFSPRPLRTFIEHQRYGKLNYGCTLRFNAPRSVSLYVLAIVWQLYGFGWEVKSLALPQASHNPVCPACRTKSCQRTVWKFPAADVGDVTGCSWQL